MTEIIESVSQDANVSRALREFNISRTAFYDKLNAEPEKWRELLDKSVETGTDALIDEARRRAYEGVTDAVYHKGDVVGIRKLYSDSLLMFLIKARRPEYRDRMFEIPPDGKFQLSINTESDKIKPDGDD